jgi:hypothetical protein
LLPTLFQGLLLSLCFQLRQNLGQIGRHAHIPKASLGFWGSDFSPNKIPLNPNKTVAEIHVAPLECQEFSDPHSGSETGHDKRIMLWKMFPYSILENDPVVPGEWIRLPTGLLVLRHRDPDSQRWIGVYYFSFTVIWPKSAFCARKPA